MSNNDKTKFIAKDNGMLTLGEFRKATAYLAGLDLGAIEARANAACLPPWNYNPSKGITAVGEQDGVIIPVVESALSWPFIARDLTFVAHAREDVPALIAAYRKLEDEIRRLRAAEKTDNLVCKHCGDNDFIEEAP